MRFSNKVVAGIIVLIALFTACALVVCYHTGAGIDTLIVSFFAFCTGELWALAGIKKVEKRCENERNNYQEIS